METTNPLKIRNLLFETYQLLKNPNHQDFEKTKDCQKEPSVLLANFVNWNPNINQWQLDDLAKKTRNHLLQSHPDKNSQSNAEQLAQAQFLFHSVKKLRDDKVFWENQKKFISCFHFVTTTTTTVTTTVTTIINDDAKSLTLFYYLNNYDEVHLKTVSVIYFVQLLGDKLNLEMEWFSYVDQKCCDFLQLIESSVSIQNYFFELENFSLAILDLLIEKVMDLITKPLLDQNYHYSRKTTTPCENEIVNQLIAMVFWLPDFQYLTRQLTKRWTQLKTFPYQILDEIKLGELLQKKVQTGKDYVQQFFELWSEQKTNINKKKRKRNNGYKPAEKKMNRDPTWYEEGTKVCPNDQVLVLPNAHFTPAQLRLYHIFQTLLLFVCYDEINQCYYYHDLRTCYEILVEKMTYYSRTSSKRTHPMYAILLKVRDDFGLTSKKIMRSFEALFEFLFPKDALLKPVTLSEQTSSNEILIFFKPGEDSKNAAMFCCMSVHYHPQQMVPIFTNLSQEKVTLTKDQMRMLQFIPMEKILDPSVSVHDLVQEVFGKTDISEYEKTVYVLKGYLRYTKIKENEQ